MTTLLASSSATNASATEGDVKAFLDNLRTFIADFLGTDSANKAAALQSLGAILSGRVAKSGAYTVVAADKGKVIDCTGTWTLSITAAATLGDGFSFGIRNSGSGAITVDPNLTEQIGGQSTLVVGAGEFLIIYCDGVGFWVAGGSGVPPGVMFGYGGVSAPPGYLLCAGQAVSRTEYAALFQAIGTTFGAGDGSTTFNVPDRRGRVEAGRDDMGGTAAGRLTSAGSGINGTVLGAAGGAQTHTLTTGQMPAHTHGIRSPAGGAGSGAFAVAADASTSSTSLTTGSTGSGSAHNNTQPTLVSNVIIKT